MAFWPTPTSSPVSTFSQTWTDTVSPGRMVSGEMTLALTKLESKPSASAEREAAATDGVTGTICMSSAGSSAPDLIWPTVGPDRGSTQPLSAATIRSARPKLAVAIRAACIDCLTVLGRRVLVRRLLPAR